PRLQTYKGQSEMPWPSHLREASVYAVGSSAGSTETKRPLLPLSWNLILPVILAKSVSSLPRPTFRPGLMRVPRWRTMMDPPGTTSPANRLTPSRCAFESRPFFELPKPFLCAISDPQNLCRSHRRCFASRFLLFCAIGGAVDFN